MASQSEPYDTVVVGRGMFAPHCVRVWGLTWASSCPEHVSLAPGTSTFLSLSSSIPIQLPPQDPYFGHEQTVHAIREQPFPLS